MLKVIGPVGEQKSMKKAKHVHTLHYHFSKLRYDFAGLGVSLLLLLFTRPLTRDGGMAEDHGAPEAGQLPRVWTRGRRETKSERRKESVAGQCRMR